MTWTETQRRLARWSRDHDGRAEDQQLR